MLDPDTMVLPPLLTTRELSDFLSVPVKSLYRWRGAGTGPESVRVGRHLRYRREDVERWLQGQRRSAGSARGTCPAARRQSDLGAKTDVTDEWVQRLVESAPAMSSEQLSKLLGIIRPRL